MTKRRPQSQDYKVGYKRPPLASRFKKGQSGNLNGRPRGASNIKNTINKILLKPVLIRENGVLRRIPALAALAAKGLNEALQGRPKQLIEVIELLQSAGFQFRTTSGTQE